MATERRNSRTISLPARLEVEVERAAADESARRGRPVTVSEWIRDAIERKLQQLKRRK